MQNPPCRLTHAQIGANCCQGGLTSTYVTTIFHFDPLHSAIAEPDQLRHAIDAKAVAQREPCFVDRARIHNGRPSFLLLATARLRPA